MIGRQVGIESIVQGEQRQTVDYTKCVTAYIIYGDRLRERHRPP